jgi:hypothetical protein
VRLDARGWIIPGMRMLAELGCPRCQDEFYGDLPAGHGLYYPMLLERQSGKVWNEFGGGVDWFAKWLRESYAHRVHSPATFRVEELRPLRTPVLLNCLDACYGHNLLKALNAQHYLDHRPDVDLIMLVPAYLRWLVPDGVAAIWTVGLPLNRGGEWNDGLAAEIRTRIARMSECWLSPGLSHPHPENFEIERFTRVKPFPLSEWDERLKHPTVTFIWRQDRLWEETAAPGRVARTGKRILGRMGFKSNPLASQTRRIIALGESLRHDFPRLNFAVAGLGLAGGLPPWITDMRTTGITADTERVWCEQYARSHVVVGVHGSNMLLPSAHAGAVVDLMPRDRWKNLAQDMLFRRQDAREMLSTHLFPPVDASPQAVSLMLASILRLFSRTQLNFSRPWCDCDAVEQSPQSIAQRYREIVAHECEQRGDQRGGAQQE